MMGPVAETQCAWPLLKRKVGRMQCSTRPGESDREKGQNVSRRAFVGAGGMAGGLAALGALPAAALASQGSAEAAPTPEPARTIGPTVPMNASPPFVVSGVVPTLTA